MIITIIEHKVRQFEVNEDTAEDFDPYEPESFLQELEVDDSYAESLTDAWEHA